MKGGQLGAGTLWLSWYYIKEAGSDYSENHDTNASEFGLTVSTESQLTLAQWSRSSTQQILE